MQEVDPVYLLQIGDRHVPRAWYLHCAAGPLSKCADFILLLGDHLVCVMLGDAAVKQGMETSVCR